MTMSRMCIITGICQRNKTQNAYAQKKVLSVTLLLLIVVPLYGCSTTQSSHNDVSCSTESITAHVLSQEEISAAAYADDIVNVKVVEETAYYKLIKMDFMYDSYIYDGNHQVVRQDGPLNPEPHISMINDHTLLYTAQSGTGRTTQWEYFFDTEKTLFSQNFSCIYDIYGENIIYQDHTRQLTVCHIFDVSQYCEEFAEFHYPLSEVAEPIINALFVEDGTAITVTYLTGADYTQATETFALNLPL